MIETESVIENVTETVNGNEIERRKDAGAVMMVTTEGELGSDGGETAGKKTSVKITAPTIVLRIEMEIRNGMAVGTAVVLMIDLVRDLVLKKTFPLLQMPLPHPPLLLCQILQELSSLRTSCALLGVPLVLQDSS